MPTKAGLVVTNVCVTADGTDELLRRMPLPNGGSLCSTYTQPK